MADRVVIVDVKRANEDLRPRDVKQMFGRAGRVHGQREKADVHIIMPERDVDVWIEKLDDESSYEVRSNLHDPKVLVFHVVSQVVNGLIVDETSYYAWYDKTFDCFQRKTRGESTPLFENVMNELRELGAVSYDKDKKLVRPLPLGKVSASFYFSPYNVRDWFLNIIKLNDKRLLENDTCQAWCVANVDGYVGWERRDVKDVMLKTLDDLEGYSLPLKPGVEGAVLAAKHVLSGTRPTTVELPEYVMIKGDIGRITNALRAIVLCSKKVLRGDRSDFVETLGLRVKYGVPTRLVGLVRLPGIGKTSARELYEKFDVTDKSGLLNRLEIIRQEGSPGLKRAMTLYLKGESAEAEPEGETTGEPGTGTVTCSGDVLGTDQGQGCQTGDRHPVTAAPGQAGKEPDTGEQDTVQR